MARRDVAMREITEIIYQWHQGRSIRGLEKSLGTDRKTIRKYLRRAWEAGIRRDQPLPADHELAALLATKHPPAVLPTPVKDRLQPHHDQLAEWLKDERMTVAQLHRLLREKHPTLEVGLTCLREYVAAHFIPRRPLVTVRLEIPPGQQAQVDFGFAGLMHDLQTGRERKTWAFIMTLSYSRYRFVRFVFKQDARTWVDCHIRAFAFFGSVPKTVVLDNLKSGVLKSDIYDPLLNRLYRDCERHFGFAADPAKAFHPEHKGRVERSVSLVKTHLLAGRTFAHIDEANERALVWCRDEIAQQPHGTTKQPPWALFIAEELPQMLQLPPAPFEWASWEQAKVHADHHVVFDGAYYSLPTRYIGADVWVRGSQRLVQIFLDEQLIKTHAPAAKGKNATDPYDYPEHQRMYLLNTRSVCLAKARAIGEATEAVMAQILSQDTMQRVRKGQAILRLGEKYSPERLEAACRRALAFDNLAYQTLKNILVQGLDHEPLAGEQHRIVVSGFCRPGSYFAQG